MKLSSLDEEIIIDIFSSFTQLANFFFINHVLITLKPLMKVFSLSKFEVNKMIFFVRFIVSEMTTMDAWWRFSKFLFGIYYLDYVWKAIFFCRKKTPHSSKMGAKSLAKSIPNSKYPKIYFYDLPNWTKRLHRASVVRGVW